MGPVQNTPSGTVALGGTTLTLQDVDGSRYGSVTVW
jgi:hypothetical protein